MDKGVYRQQPRPNGLSKSRTSRGRLSQKLTTAMRDGSIQAADAIPRPVRTVAHVEGNWPTFVYIPVSVKGEIRDELKDWIARATSDTSPWHSHVELGSEESLGLHVSLCRTVYLKVFQIDRFMSLLEQHLRLQSSFAISFVGASVYVNDEKTRSFVGLDIGHGHQELEDLVRCVDLALVAFHQPTFYKLEIKLGDLRYISLFARTLSSRQKSRLKEIIVLTTTHHCKAASTWKAYLRLSPSFALCSTVAQVPVPNFAELTVAQLSGALQNQ
ncbi:hypothetical protein BASA61_001395 [Batrachochytrium salamandrivorans]|nr:hypothetical protein BASA60_001932 [Batrachochytrium salamandrivorans]KAH6602149.1 hypothetical protein BASA61_001395 [Batrachochytrium salamandrivorans]KAH9264149.1 hypothetical protein BASA83_012407 [Batrachochytrium salamandrivorans]